MTKPYLISANADPALSLSVAKTHLEVDFSDRDALITDLAKAAENAWVEDSGRVLMESTWEQAYDSWPACGYFEINRYPVSSVTSIKYTPSEGAELTLSSSVYALYNGPFRRPRVYLKYGQIWPSSVLEVGPSIRIRFVAGEASAAAIPQDILAALKIRLGELYSDRDGMIEIRSFNQLSGSDRVWNNAKVRHGIES